MSGRQKEGGVLADHIVEIFGPSSLDFVYLCFRDPMGRGKGAAAEPPPSLPKDLIVGIHWYNGALPFFLVCEAALRFGLRPKARLERAPL